MVFWNKTLSLIVLLAIPCAASAEEWRFCMGGDQVGENLRAPLMFTRVFRSDLVPEYEQQVASHIERNLTITGEVSVGCTDPYPTEDGATGKMIEWLDLMTNGDVAIEVVSARWEPKYQAAPESVRQAASAVAPPSASVSQTSSHVTQDATSQAAAQETAASAEAQRPAEPVRREETAEQRRQYWEQQRAAAQQGVAPTGAGAGAKPLRFVLSVGLRPQIGDTHNPFCYSNVITRPGPPGWGSPGFLPTGSAEQAIQTIESLKAAFITKCRAVSGREIDGSINHWRNQSERDESDLDSVRARSREDVTVQMD